MQTIAIDRLAPDPKNVRIWNADEAANNQLTASVRAIGIIQPIVIKVHPDEPERFMIVTGHRRFAAAQAAGLTEVPVAMFTGHDSTVTQLAENMVRAPMRTADVWAAVSRLLDEGWSSEDVALAFNLSDRRILQFRLMGQLPDPIVAYVRETNDVPPDHVLRRLVYADQEKLAEAFKRVVANNSGNLPWLELAAKSEIHRIDMSRACWEVTAEDRATLDVRTDFFDPADHPGYAYEVAAFMERQVAEIEATLAEWKKKGFETMLVRLERDLTNSATKRLDFTGIDYAKAGKVAKAKREGLVIVASLAPSGVLNWLVLQKKPEAAKSEPQANGQAKAEPATVTKAADPLIDAARRKALADHLGDTSPTPTLLAACAVMLLHRIGWDRLPAGFYADGGPLHDILPARDAAVTILQQACMASAVGPELIERLGYALGVQPSITMNAEQLAMLKAPAIEHVFKARGVPMPDGTLKAKREALMRLLSTGDTVTLLASDLPVLAFQAKPDLGIDDDDGQPDGETDNTDD